MTTTKSVVRAIATLGFGAVMALFGCSTPPEQQDRIVVGVLEHGSSIPIVVANSSGLFTKRGLSVELRTLSPAQHMPALLRGDVQILSASSFPVIFSTAEQNPETILAYMTGGEATDGDPIYGIVVPRTSEATDLSALVGKRLGTSSKFITVNLQNVLGAKFGDRGRETSIREISDRALLLEALGTDSLDAVVLDQPALSGRQVTEGFKVIEQNFRAKYLGNPYWSGAGIVRRDWVNSDPDQFRNFLAALDEALAAINADRRKAKEIFVAHFKVADLTIDRVGMYVYPSAAFAPPQAFVDELAATLKANGMLTKDSRFQDLFYR